MKRSCEIKQKMKMTLLLILVQIKREKKLMMSRSFTSQWLLLKIYGSLNQVRIRIEVKVFKWLKISRKLKTSSSIQLRIENELASFKNTFIILY